MKKLILQIPFQDETSIKPRLRNICEIKEILKDLRKIQRLIDEDISYQDYAFLIDYFKTSQLVKWHDKQMAKVEKMKSYSLYTCESIGCANVLLDMYNNRFKKIQESSLGGIKYLTTDKLTPFESASDYSLDDFIKDLNDLSRESASKDQLQRVNYLLDHLEYFGGCKKVAYSKDILDEAIQLAYGLSNLSVPKSAIPTPNSPSSQFRS